MKNNILILLISWFEELDKVYYANRLLWTVGIAIVFFIALRIYLWVKRRKGDYYLSGKGFEGKKK